LKLPAKNLHNIFWISIPILILIGFLNRGRFVDINIYDTYYILDFPLITYLISFIFLIIGLGYRIMQRANKKVSRLLLRVHIMLTFGGLLVIWVLSLFYRLTGIGFEFNNNLSLVIYLISLIIILGQLLFPINMLRGMIKKTEITSQNN